MAVEWRGTRSAPGLAIIWVNCMDAPGQSRAASKHWDAYEALVLGQKHGDTGIDLADSEGDEHGAYMCGCAIVL